MKLHLENNDYLAIEVLHNDGGINYFNYKREAKGVYVHFTKETIEKKDGYTSTQMSPFDACNFKVLALTYNRKSQKQIDKVHAYVKEQKDTLLALWKNDDKEAIYDIIKGIQ